MQVVVASPQQVFFEGEAQSVSSTNSKGKFDILDGHSNFITMVRDPIIILTHNEKIELKFKSAVIHAKDNQVDIYTGV
jgi:F0F1-type ATP synthase epsilon subunit